jgi:pimeloyl-ACP methyl ester carboxylesterase
MIQEKHFVHNGDGWLLGLKQTYEPRALERSRRPVVIIPGYGMNAFIFGYHPRGKSMEAYWADEGFEVWSMNLRAQGNSKRVGGNKQYGFYDAAVTDLGAAFDFIARNTKTEAGQLDAVGCSLGGTYLYANLALCADKNQLGSVVTIGAPLQWVEVNPVLKTAFASPRVAGMLAIRGIRPFARVAMPVLTRIPKLLQVYLHPEIVDTSRMKEMIQTVENPNRTLNRQIAEWLKRGDLVVRGINVTEAVANAKNPLLVVLSNADGIVPEATALSAYHKMGSSVKDVLCVGTPRSPGRSCRPLRERYRAGMGLRAAGAVAHRPESSSPGRATKRSSRAHDREEDQGSTRVTSSETRFLPVPTSNLHRAGSLFFSRITER